MRDFTKEEIEALSVLEPHFKTAVELHYTRNVPKPTVEMAHKIYEDALGKPFNTGGSCSYCLYNLIRTIGAKYFQDKEKLEAKAAKMVEVLDEVFGEVPDEEPAPKKPTNKKQNKKK